MLNTILMCITTLAYTVYFIKTLKHQTTQFLHTIFFRKKILNVHVININNILLVVFIIIKIIIVYITQKLRKLILVNTS